MFGLGLKSIYSTFPLDPAHSKLNPIVVPLLSGMESARGVEMCGFGGGAEFKGVVQHYGLGSLISFDNRLEESVSCFYRVIANYHWDLPIEQILRRRAVHSTNDDCYTFGIVSGL